MEMTVIDMRLIDADELEPDTDYDDGDYWAVSIAQIQNASTIERKTGKWIWQISGKYMCSECGKITTVDECMEEPMYIYCPYCGVKIEYFENGRR